MKKLILTGVAGFIGAHTLEHILENTDWNVFGIDDLEHKGDYRRIEQVLIKNPKWAKRFEFALLDLAKSKSLDSLIGDFRLRHVDYIINMASDSHVDRSIDDPVPFVKNNVNLTLTMLELARKLKPEVFIQISTDEVYGAMYDRPYVEWERLVPSNPYSASKAAQEMIATAYWRTYNVPLVITNTMNNIGEMQDCEKFVPMLIRDIMAGKKVSIHGSEDGSIGTRFYLHARNHADALLFLLKRQPTMFNYQADAKPDRYNIVGDTQLDNLEMAQSIARLLDKPLEYFIVDFHSTRPGHDMHYGLNGTKIERLGWKAPLSFHESLKRTVTNYMENPQWLK